LSDLKNIPRSRRILNSRKLITIKNIAKEMAPTKIVRRIEFCLKKSKQSAIANPERSGLIKAPTGNFARNDLALMKQTIPKINLEIAVGCALDV
jgi:hypothetical protein